LLKLEAEFQGVKNLNVLVEENQDSDEVIFLRKIVEGGTDRSYGIYVAQMAGLPEEVIKRARLILQDLEERNNDIEGLKEKTRKAKESEAELYEASLFSYRDHPVLDELHKLEVEKMTPVEALNKLNELKNKADTEA
jgi:DNA mismatch repair protein MutS